MADKSATEILQNTSKAFVGFETALRVARERLEGAARAEHMAEAAAPAEGAAARGGGRARKWRRAGAWRPRGPGPPPSPHDPRRPLLRALARRASRPTAP